MAAAVAELDALPRPERAARALLRCWEAKLLADLKGGNSDQDAGIAIVRRALEAPLRQIAENAGVDGAVVAGKIRESSDKNFGFNAQTEEYGDMFKFGVIDPAKVTRTALEDAASVASLLITTEAMIADKPSVAAMTCMKLPISSPATPARAVLRPSATLRLRT